MLYLFLLLGFCFFASIMISITFNALPPAWLCDYGQETSSTLQEIRINVKRWTIPFTLLLAISSYLLIKNYPFQEALILFIIICLLTQICISDLLYMIIPDQHIAAIFVLAVLFIYIQSDPYPFKVHLIGGLLGGGLYLLVSLISFLFKKHDSIGFGDIKLMAALGFLVGTYDILFIFVSATLLSTVFLVLLLLFRKISLHSFLPLAPFISVAFILQISI